MICECGQGPRIRPGAGCRTCNEIDQWRYQRDSVRQRAVTALGHFDDWTLSVDLRTALDLSDSEAVTLSAELGRLYRAGEVERMTVKGGMMYRIAQRRAA